MTMTQQFFGAFITTSLFFLGATTVAANREERESSDYSFSAQYTPEDTGAEMPPYFPI